MELSKLAPAKGARKKKKRVGRGESSGWGKTSGRGGKGQTARTGGGVRPGFEGGQMPFYRRIPKIGFVSGKKSEGINEFNVINLSDLEQFEAGSVIDAEALSNAGHTLRNSKKGGVKILGKGTLTKKLTLKVDAVSETARARIEELGGKIELNRTSSAE